MEHRGWSSSTKRLILTACLVAVGLVVWRFSVIIPPLMIAIILAYLLNPAVEFIIRRTHLRRGWAILILYAGLIIILILILLIFTPLLVREMREAILEMRRLGGEARHLRDRPLVLLNIEVDAQAVYNFIDSAIRDAITPLISQTITLALDIASFIAWLIIILVVSAYLLVDAHRLIVWFDNLVLPPYRQEVQQLRQEVAAVWDAFLRGQLTLCLIVGFTIGLLTAALGVRNAIILGIVAGIMELVPNLGHALSALVGVSIAFLRGSSYLPLSNFWFAILVLGVYVLIFQIDANYLIPRIIGGRVRLPPAVILVGIVAGAALAGVLGILLAAPTLATLRILGSYLYRRLFDLEPFVTPEQEREALARPSPSSPGKELKPLADSQQSETAPLAESE
jgi:predicted PurR-regulated permease PerM